MPVLAWIVVGIVVGLGIGVFGTCAYFAVKMKNLF